MLIPDDVDDASYIVDIFTDEKTEILEKKSCLAANLCTLKIHSICLGLNTPLCNEKAVIESFLNYNFPLFLKRCSVTM